MDYRNFQYTQREAGLEDLAALIQLWMVFLEERMSVDSSLTLKKNFNLSRYITYQLQRQLTYIFILEAKDYSSNDTEVIGFLCTYFYDESPHPDLISVEDLLESPFETRRIGAVIGLYVHKQHRSTQNIKLIIDAAIAKAEELKVSDIDLLISAEQTGLHCLLERDYNFVKSAVQYTRHYDLSNQENLPSLHLVSENYQDSRESHPKKIPLRNPKTYDIVKNSEGQTIFLEPIVDQSGETLKNSSGLPIYPTPLRDPQTNDWVFDQSGQLIFCPLLLEGNGEIVEYLGIPQFCQPIYQKKADKLVLKQDELGKYQFSEAQRDNHGMVLRSPNGKPIF